MDNKNKKIKNHICIQTNMYQEKKNKKFFFILSLIMS